MSPKKKRKSKASSSELRPPLFPVAPSAAAHDFSLAPPPGSTTLWTTDHALIGQVSLHGRALVPGITHSKKNGRQEEEERHGGIVEANVDIACFHPEELRQRQPALWRGYLMPSSSTKATDTESHKTSIEDSDQARTQPRQRPPAPHLPRAVDVIASDLTNRSFALLAPMPTMHLKSLEDRLFRVIYQRVVSHHMPLLIMAAACEEIQTQYLKQYAQLQQASQQQQSISSNSSSSKKGWNTKPPEYYSKTPNSYLTPPVAPTTAAKSESTPSKDQSSSFPSFTPSQLNARIKQGCTLMWKHYCDHHYHPPPPPPPPPAASSSSATAANAATEMSSAWDRRRSSSRIARQQQFVPPESVNAPSSTNHLPTATTEQQVEVDDAPSPYWKVLSGGKVALHLYERLLPKKPSATAKAAEAEAPEQAATTTTTIASAAANATSQLPSMDERLDNDANDHTPDLKLTDNISSSTLGTSSTDKVTAPPEADDSATNEAKDRAVASAPEAENGTNPADDAEVATLDGTSQIITATENGNAVEGTSVPGVPTSADSGDNVVATGVAGSSSSQAKDSATTTPASATTAVDKVETVSDATLASAPNNVVAYDGTSAQADSSVEATKQTEPESTLNTSETAENGTELVIDNVEHDEEAEDTADHKDDDKDDEDFVPPGEDDDEHEEDDEEAMKRVRFVKENVQELVLEAKAAAKTSATAAVDVSTNITDPQLTTGESVEVDPEGVGDSDDEEFDEDMALVMNNPYFNPTAPAVLEFLGRKTAKLLTVSDLQEILPKLLYKSKKKAKKPSGVAMDDFLTDLDRQVWNKIDDAAPVTATPDFNARVALKLTHEHEDENVERWETSYFARTHLTIRFLDERNRMPLVKPDEHLAELWEQYKERKAWDKWRYKSIHGGFAIWPSWMEAVRERLSGSNASTRQRLTVEASTVGAVTSETHDDYAVAQALAQEAAPGTDGTGRRTTRRGGDSTGVFYGNQSNMTQKQLMDTILRLISERGYQTAASLVAAVPDESSDPLRRIRGALGKLVWKRNQISQLGVRSDWTDEPLLKHLATKPIKLFVEDESGPVPDEAVALSQYLKYLHETELRLRHLVLERMARVPIVVVATAADERPGSMEAMDSSYFTDPSMIQWNRTGHNRIGSVIFRPSDTVNSNEHSVCRWYRITSFCESVASTQMEDETNPLDRPNIGLAKEAKTVERRMRFQASPIRAPDDSAPVNGSDVGALLLTEAQVYAGLKAADLERQDSLAKDRSRNPFADGSEPQVTLFPVNDAAADQQIHGVVAGHDTCMDVDNGQMYHRIFLVPQGGEAMWVRMETQPDGALQCFIDGRNEPFSIQQFDYHSSSPAFRECQAIVQFLQRHPKAGPFLAPVDPIALKIPQYYHIVKNPMDISTLSQKLERGQYSNIGPGQTTGLSPVARMLNGPFRNDVELIFDNAMLFNPPDDWIYLAAGAVKKAVLKKIEQAAAAADQKTYKQAVASKSIYVDYDSDVDMYVYESDQDDDYVSSSRRKRKRSAAQQVLKEDTSTRAVERPFRLQKILSESTGLRGPLSDFPISSNAASFTLPGEWTCRYSTLTAVTTDMFPVDRDGELDELLSLRKQLEESEATGQRRSTRSHDHGDVGSVARSDATNSSIEYVPGGPLTTVVERMPTNRVEVEYQRERLHEEYFCKLWRDHHKRLQSNLEESEWPDSNFGSYADGSFPPYLGRVVPLNRPNEFVWEIREPFVIAAMRWVLRGLIQSGHLSESESMTADSLLSGAVLINNVYTLSDGEPFEELDVRELTRRKRADQEAPSSEDEVELSEYEKLRLERVARNEERLRALGLA